MTTESFDAAFPLRVVFFFSATTVLGAVEEAVLVEVLDDILFELKIRTRRNRYAVSETHRRS